MIIKQVMNWEISLVSPEVIDSTKTYLFGVIISEYEMGTYPMGVDTGPEVDGFETCWQVFIQTKILSQDIIFIYGKPCLKTILI